MTIRILQQLELKLSSVYDSIVTSFPLISMLYYLFLGRFEINFTPI